MSVRPSIWPPICMPMWKNVCLSILLSTLLYASMNFYFSVCTCVCGRGYNSLSVCPIPSCIRLSDQIDGHTNNPGGGQVVRRCWVNFQCRGVLLIWIAVGQGPIVLAVGAGGGCLDIFFSHLQPLFSFFLSLGDGPI